jgi:uncharacterized protein
VTVLGGVVVLVAAVLGGGVQATLGFGAAFTTVPALAVFAPSLVPVAALVGLLPLTAGVWLRERHALDRDAFLRVATGRVPGILAGTAVVAVAPQRTLTLVVAVTLALAVAVSATGVRIPVTPRTELGVGVVSGFTGTAAALGGPPLAVLYRDRGAADRRATLSAVFAVGLVLSLVTLGLAGEVDSRDLTVGAGLGAAMLVGSVAAVPLTRRLPEHVVRAAVLVWAAVGAVVAILRVVLG